MHARKACAAVQTILTKSVSPSGTILNMGDSRALYMTIEGAMFAGILVITSLVCIVTNLCLVRCLRKDESKLASVGGQYIRAGETLIRASLVITSGNDNVNEPFGGNGRGVGMQHDSDTEGGNGDRQRLLSSQPQRNTTSRPGPENRAGGQQGSTKKRLLEAGRQLEKVGVSLLDSRKSCNELYSVTDEAGQEYEDILSKARTSLQYADVNAPFTKEDYVTLKENVETLLGACRKTQERRDCCRDVPNWLLSLYHLVFNKSIEKVTIPGADHTSEQIYLFGGYAFPKHPVWLHVYYLSMLFIVAIWFVIVWIDTAIFIKTATCNDLNLVDNVYACFDVKDSFTNGPIDCLDSANKDTNVICYLHYFGLIAALSIAYGFTQLVIIVIERSFAFTLSCIKKITPKCTFFLYLSLFTIILLGVITYTVCVYTNVQELRYKETNFPFYGDRVMHWANALWMLVTLFTITVLSPYCWLIDKYNHEYKSSFMYNEITV